MTANLEDVINDGLGRLGVDLTTLTADEDRFLAWMAGWDDSTVAAFLDVAERVADAREAVMKL